ncbi:Glutaredoxin domain-containing cysteine-rich protein 1 [Folsomia candida]|uniref:Glutaredoxin domain-containing cysteine-rich protein 1 n=1 Tax=Folsomia candida TaxID=158441 RepID=A0A226D0B7_FOLCA|nr:Glutaredoxin domain-containing cysteine-rich protein 1 [Folsomia candida]
MYNNNIIIILLLFHPSRLARIQFTGKYCPTTDHFGVECMGIEESLSVLSTCEKCGGFRMLPCQICNGSKKSVHRNHFTTEFIALKCMHCDPSGLVRCDLCNSPDP